MSQSRQRFWSGDVASVQGAALYFFALVALLTPPVKGQGFGPDPFRPYNAQYDAFVYPIAPGPLDYGHSYIPQAGIRGANQYESYLNSLQGGARGAGGGPGTPYFRANRAYDREYGRIYQPNKEADASFQSNQDIVNDLYFKYLRERDPKKRAELFRDYNRARSRADRALNAPRGLSPRAGTRSARTGAEARSTRAAEGDSGSDDRNSHSTPPATTSPARTPGASARRAGDLLRDESPSPLSDSSTTGTPSRSQTPSQVLDRATRADRMRLGPRPRVTPPTSDPLEPPIP